MRVIALTHVFPRHDGDPSAPFLATWATALRDAGHDVRVIAPHDSGLREVATVHGVPVRFVRYASDDREVLAYRGEMHRIATRPTGPPLLSSLLVNMAAALRRAVRRWRPDVVHVHWWVPGAIIARTARVDVPIVVHLHGTDVGVIENRPALGGVARWALGRADRIEVVSSDLAERAARAIGVVARGVNPMPLPVSRLQPVEPISSLDVPVVLGVGRLIPEKGFADLLDAVALLRGPVRLRLVGDGPESDRLREQALEQGVMLELPGRVDPDDMVAEYAAADVVVQPSHGEGLGMVAAEAAALGRPVVATDSGGVRDLLSAGRLVRVGDVEAMAARIDDALREGSDHAMDEEAMDVRRLLSPGSSVARTVAGWNATIAAHAR